MLCGFTVGGRLRNRRLIALQAQELTSSDAKVIDVALEIRIRVPGQLRQSVHQIPWRNASAAKQKGSRLNALRR